MQRRAPDIAPIDIRSPIIRVIRGKDVRLPERLTATEPGTIIGPVDEQNQAGLKSRESVYNEEERPLARTLWSPRLPPQSTVDGSR